MRKMIGLVLLAVTISFVCVGRAKADCEVTCTSQAGACTLEIPSGCTYATWICNGLSNATVAISYFGVNDIYLTPNPSPKGSGTCILKEKVGQVGGNLQLVNHLPVTLDPYHVYHAHWNGKYWNFDAP